LGCEQANHSERIVTRDVKVTRWYWKLPLGRWFSLSHGNGVAASLLRRGNLAHDMSTHFTSQLAGELVRHVSSGIKEDQAESTPYRQPVAVLLFRGSQPSQSARRRWDHKIMQVLNGCERCSYLPQSARRLHCRYPYQSLPITTVLTTTPVDRSHSWKGDLVRVEQRTALTIPRVHPALTATLCCSISQGPAEQRHPSTGNCAATISEYSSRQVLLGTGLMV
jgi:hypothetical protein